MTFIKTFKGYEDKIQMLDQDVNSWILKNKPEIKGFQSAMSHEDGGGRAGSGDLIYTILYEADEPID
jgi:hypothetical protein